MVTTPKHYLATAGLALLFGIAILGVAFAIFNTQRHCVRTIVKPCSEDELLCRDCGAHGCKCWRCVEWK